MRRALARDAECCGRDRGRSRDLRNGEYQPFFAGACFLSCFFFFCVWFVLSTLLPMHVLAPHTHAHQTSALRCSIHIKYDADADGNSQVLVDEAARMLRDIAGGGGYQRARIMHRDL